MNAIRRPRGVRPSIRTKILTIAWAPSFVLLTVGVVVAAIFARQSANEKSFTDTYAQAVTAASTFASADQRERQLTVSYLLNPGSSRLALDAQRVKTTTALTQLGPVITALRDTGSDSFVTTISTSGAKAGGLPDLRKGVDSGALTWWEAANAYSQTLDVFHAAFETLATSAATAKIASEYQLTADLFRLTEWHSESDVFNQAAYSPKGLTDPEFGLYLDRVGGYHSLLTTAVPRLPPVEQAQYKALTSSPAWEQLTMLESTALRSTITGPQGATVHRAGTLPISRSDWELASAQVSQGLIDQYKTQASYATSLANHHARQLFLRSLYAAVALLALALLIFLLVTRMSNRLIRRLRKLRSETLEVAGQRLPTIVDRLGKGEPVDLERELPALDHGSDEIGQVADAFNQAQRVAVAAAAKEAETRAGTSKVFLNIAHRSQIVAHRQLKLLDQAERTQEDPDQLSLLFQLDHLTTRSRRNAENLIILGGGQPGRQWRNPVPLVDVVRSAVGESETYTGISLGQLPEVWLAGNAVADVIHLLAELVDNATSFSPPTARVEVRGNVAGRGIVIEIEDQGLGIEPDQLEELNKMLVKPPDFGVMALSDEPRLGLFVVTQLAVRHGVRVTLTESRSYGGIRAVVLIPVELITSAESQPQVEATVGSVRSDPRAMIPGRGELTGEVLPTRRPNRMIANAAVDQPTGGARIAEPSPAPSTPAAPSLPFPSSSPSTSRSAPPSAAPPLSPPSGPRHEPGIPEPVARPSTPSRPAERYSDNPWTSPITHARKEGERQTAEIPAIQAPIADHRGSPTRRPEPMPSGPIAQVGQPAQRGQAAQLGQVGQVGQVTTGAVPLDRSNRPPLPHRIKQSHLAPQLFEDARKSTAPQPVSADPVPSPENARDRMAAFQLGTRRGRQSDSGPNS